MQTGHNPEAKRRKHCVHKYIYTYPVDNMNGVKLVIVEFFIYIFLLSLPLPSLKYSIQNECTYLYMYFLEKGLLCK